MTVNNPNPQLICDVCAAPAKPEAWRCATCGGTLHIANLPAFDPDAIRDHEWSLWRYADMLPANRRFSLGEGMTPLVPVSTGDVPFLAKLEYLLPSGSYKDRGVAVMLNALLAQDVDRIVEDSSGNAGASVAAYAGGIGMDCQIFVPAAAPQAKKAQIAGFGATLVEVAGPRSAVTEAVEAAAAEATYASHAWNPHFIAGQLTTAWEIWEQMGRRAPAAVAAPVGQGGLFLGLYYGFKALLNAEAISTMPRLYAIQSAAFDPIVSAWEQRADDVAEPCPGGPTSADGIKIARPLRSRQILKALYETEGAAFRVAEADLLAARKSLAHSGLFVEPTSAVPAAALSRILEHIGQLAEIVIPLTGHGLKATDQEIS